MERNVIKGKKREGKAKVGDTRVEGGDLRRYVTVFLFDTIVVGDR
jgi:hypothetical protein